MDQLVFVYGTLKRGEVNHHWLEGSLSLGETWLRGLNLYDLGPFPMAVEGEGRVRGELYAVDGEVLARLDRIEGYPRLYNRLQLPLDDGRVAWVYVGRPRQVRHSPLLGDGEWQARPGNAQACPTSARAAAPNPSSASP